MLYTRRLLLSTAGLLALTVYIVAKQARFGGSQDLESSLNSAPYTMSAAAWDGLLYAVLATAIWALWRHLRTTSEG